MLLTTLGLLMDAIVEYIKLDAIMMTARIPSAIKPILLLDFFVVNLNVL